MKNVCKKTFCKNSATNCEKDRPTHAYKSGASEEASQKRCQEGKKEKESILRINRYVFSVSSKRSRKIRYTLSPNNAVSTYSRVRNKHTPTLINFLTFFQGLRPYSWLHRAYLSSISIRYKWGYAYSFCQIFQGLR